MDFVEFEEAWSSLAGLNIIRLENSTEEEFRPGLDDSDELVILDLLGATPNADSVVVQIDPARAADALEALLHKLHLAPVLLFPIGRWRHVFDTISFELAGNEEWQEIESTSIVELNTHDPLMCEPQDLHLVHDVLATVLRCGTESRQGITVTALGKPILIAIEPPQNLRIELVSEPLAAEVQELLAPFSASAS